MKNNVKMLSPEEKLLRAIFGEPMEDSGYRSEVNGVTLKQAIEAALCTLTPRQIEIIRTRFGFNDRAGSGMTYKKVGEAFGVTGGRARQITMTALRRLRHPSRSHQLKAYLEDEDADKGN